MLSADNFTEARVFNFSKGGLYIESLNPITPETDVAIMMINYNPGTYGPEAYKSYIAQVKWSKDISENGSPKHGFGVEFLSKSHEVCEILVPENVTSCDLCGKLIPSEDNYYLDDMIVVCPNCNKHLSALPDGQIKECIKRFLIGNVI
jgi:hypothetical protein